MKSINHSAWHRVKAESMVAKVMTMMTTKEKGNIILAKGDVKTAQALE